MGRKKKEEKVKLDYFERRKKLINPDSACAHDIFVDVNEHQQVTEKTEQGIRVLVARYPDFYKIYFHSYLQPGTPSFPRGGVRVWNATHDQMQYFYFESVAIHPEGGFHKFYNKEEDGEK
jgi:hypothetical protein